MLLLSLVLTKSPTAIALFPVVLSLYVPISYYTDLWLYRRRMRNKGKRAPGKAASK